MFEDPAAIRAKRDSIFRTGRLLFSDGRDVACRVRNISAGGACVDHKGDLRQGQRFRLAIGRDPDIEARVMWASDKLAGIAFGPTPTEAEEETPAELRAGWLASLPDPYRRLP